MNPDKQKIKAVSGVAELQKLASLGEAQLKLEATTAEFIAAQASFVKATERLKLAVEAHVCSMEAIVNEMNTVRSRCKVPSLLLK